MCNDSLNKLCTLTVGFSGADGRQQATIPGTHRPAKVGRIYWTPGHPVGEVAVIDLPHDALGRSPQSSIPYLWIFEGAFKEEVGF